MKDKYLYNLQRQSTSGGDILNYINGKANLITYPEIYKYKTLEQLLGPYGAAIILYEWKDGFGHWITVFRTKHGVEIFDPYGYRPDDEFKFISKDFKNENYPDTKYLSKLIYNSRLPLEYNDHKLQNEKDKSIATCGPWTAIRLANRNIPLENFNKILREFKPYTPDEIVALLFYNK